MLWMSDATDVLKPDWGVLALDGTTYDFSQSHPHAYTDSNRHGDCHGNTLAHGHGYGDSYSNFHPDIDSDRDDDSDNYENGDAVIDTKPDPHGIRDTA